jgi:5'-nucleotidase
MQQYHYNSAEGNLGLNKEALGASKVVSTSARDVIEEYFSSHQNLMAAVEGRLVYLS